MAGRARLIQTNFGGGEISRKARARPDLDIYAGAMDRCENFVPQAAGSLDRRPGTVRLGAARAATASRLFSLVKSINDVVRIEAGGGKFRFWDALSRTQILDGVSPLELDIPWADDELAGLRDWQRGDVIWFAHVSHAYPVYALRRTGAATFTLDPVAMEEGPFLDRVDGAPTLTFSAVSGSVTVTAGAASFTPDHVGALIRCEADTMPLISSWSFDQKTVVGEFCRNGNRIYEALAAPDPSRTGNSPPIHEEGDAWDGNQDDNIKWRFKGFTYGLLQITGYTSATQVTATVLRRLPFYGTGVSLSTSYWQLSALSDVEGWPACGTIYEERQCVFGSIGESDKAFASRTAKWSPLAFDHRPGFVTETLDTDAVRKSLAEHRTATCVWALVMDQMMIGTTSGVRTLSGPSADEALTPAGAVPRTLSTVPCSALVRPVLADNSLLYLAPGEEELIEISRDPQVAPRNLLEVADHMAGGGLRDMAWVGRPRRALWVVDRRGRLRSLTLSPENGTVGWSRHRLGGNFAGRHAVVECVDGAPGPDGRDELWLIVKRTIGGVTVRTVEFMERPFDTDTMRLEDCCCLDLAGYFDLWQSYTVLATFDGTDVVLTAQGGATPFVAGDVDRQFWLSANEDLPDEADEPSPVRLRIIEQVSTSVLKAQLVGAYDAGAWQGRVMRIARCAKSLSLPWLAGEEIYLNADGMTVGPLTVPEGGTLDLTSDASEDGIRWVARGWAGLRYASLARSLPVNGGEGLGSSRTAMGRVSGVGILPDAIGEGRLRRRDQHPDYEVAINPRQASAPLGTVTPPLTEDKFIPLDKGFDRHKQVEILADGALPCSVGGFLLQVESYG